MARMPHPLKATLHIERQEHNAGLNTGVLKDTTYHVIEVEADSMDELLERLGTQTDTLN